MRTSRAAPLVAIAILLIAGCRSTEPVAEGPAPPESDSQEVAPWQRAPLAQSAVPSVYLEEWWDAENQIACDPIAPAALGQGEGATVRSAYFGGGWGVAYDLPELRSAFGVAGTGAEAAESSYDEWPFHREWPDGSTAGYGPEGGSGPNQLAYLRIEGQECLYNVWSRLGVDHLEFLLDQLRFVETR